MNIDEFKSDIERHVKFCIEELSKDNNFFDHAEERYELRCNKGYNTILFCNIAVIRIKRSKNKETSLELSKKYIDLFGLQNDIRYTTSDILWGKLPFNERIAMQIINSINRVFKQCYMDEAVDNFSCCSRYHQCSDEKKCIHPDIKFAKGCHYKTHLENGRIFYGNNRNDHSFPEGSN
jgi:hypothetical protein